MPRCPASCGRHEFTLLPGRSSLLASEPWEVGWSPSPLVGSSPVIILPIFAFQFLIAIPASIYCLCRLAPKSSYSGYHTVAVWLHLCGILLPLAVYVIGTQFEVSQR